MKNLVAKVRGRGVMELSAREGNGVQCTSHKQEKENY